MAMQGERTDRGFSKTRLPGGRREMTLFRQARALSPYECYQGLIKELFKWIRILQHIFPWGKGRGGEGKGIGREKEGFLCWPI